MQLGLSGHILSDNQINATKSLDLSKKIFVQVEAPRMKEPEHKVRYNAALVFWKKRDSGISFNSSDIMMVPKL